MTVHRMAGRTTPNAIRISQPDGCTTAVHDFGGQGPVLLFAHATGMHGLVWKPVIDELIDRAHCIAVDLRGHGDSTPRPGADLSWELFGGDVLAAVAAIDGDEVIGVGHSLGGAALLMAELAAAGTFTRLFLYEPALPGMAE